MEGKENSIKLYYNTERDSVLELTQSILKLFTWIDSLKPKKFIGMGKVAFEFINAAVSKKFAFNKNIVWSIEQKADAFLLKIQTKEKKTECTLSIDSFYKELENLKI